MSESIHNGRRALLENIARSSACVLCGGFLSGLFASCEAEDPVSQSSDSPEISDPVINLSTEKALNDVGGSVHKRFSSVNGSKTVLIIRSGTSTFVAFAAQCTHAGTQVNLPSSNVIVCPNHGSRFNATTGSVIQGPAGAPLPKISVVYNADQNTITIG